MPNLNKIIKLDFLPLVLIFLTLTCGIVTASVLGLDYQYSRPDYWILVIIAIAVNVFCFTLSLIVMAKAMPTKRSNRVTLVVLAALCLSFLLHASAWACLHQNSLKERNRQKRTMGLLKAWSSAWSDHCEEMGALLIPVINRGENGHWGNVPILQAMNAHKALSLGVGQYPYGSLEAIDAWGGELQLMVVGESASSYRFYIRSAGKDGKWQAERYIPWPHELEDYDSDVVIGKDRLYRWPYGNWYEDEPWEIPHKAMDHKVVPY